MSRISPLTGLRSLQSAVAVTPATPRAPFAVAARAISTSTPVSSNKKTEWIRGKLWKDKAPGPKDPYTQRSDPEELESKLPEDALERPDTELTQPAARNTTLVFPNKRTEAKTPEEIAKLDPTYEPATKLDELDVVKPLSNWWNQPGHWGPESRYAGFANTVSSATRRDSAVVEVYVRRALAETLALRLDPTRQHVNARQWRQGNRDHQDRALALTVVVDKDGTPRLHEDDVAERAGAVARNLDGSNYKGVRTETLSKEEAAEIVKAWTPEWKRAVLDDTLRFTIRKRLYQFTGNYIPDAKLGAANTVAQFLRLATKEPAPKKLAEAVRTRVDLKQFPNIKLHDRRVSVKQKEVALGRWKLIEAELEKRNVPVKGTAGYTRNKELDWLLGKE